jgi:Tol biopolymer transport system component/DNA-binding winged helix-turn-helix (wHTH) protein
MSLDCSIIEFGHFRLDTRERVLLHDGKPVTITPKTLQLLLVLAQNPGRLMEKAELMESVWSGSFVEESNLTFTVRQLRKVLGDDKSNPKFLQTVPKRGYRFIADTRFFDADLTPPLEERNPEKSSSSLDVGGSPTEVRKYEENTSHSTRRGSLIFVSFGAVIVIVVLGVLFWGRSTPNNNAASALKFDTIASSVGAAAAISPNGNYIVYSLKTDGREALWLRNPLNGSNVQIVAPLDDVAFGALKFSPDSRYIYFLRSYQNGVPHLDRIAVDGGTVESNIITGIANEFSISSDGQRLSYRPFLQNGSLVTSNLDGSDAHTIYETNGIITDNLFSPDGTMVAFASGQTHTGGRDFAVFIADPKTGDIRPASDFRWFYVRGILWLPDQSSLIITARLKAGDTQQLWKISLSDGDVRRVTESQKSFGVISATANLDRILLIQTTRDSNLFLTSAAQQDNGRLITRASLGVTWAGKDKLVYVSGSAGNNDVWLLDLDRDTQRQLTYEDSNEVDPSVSPDGRYFVFVSDKNGRNNLWRESIEGGPAVQLTNGGGEQAPVFAPDGEYLYYSEMPEKRLLRIPIGGGESIQISNKQSYDVSISPDGLKYAYIGTHTGKLVVLVRSIQDQDAPDILNVPDGLGVSTTTVVWTPDGKSVVYALSDAGLVANLWRQSVSSHIAERITNYSTDEIFDFAISADGTQIAIVRGSWISDVVVTNGAQLAN